MAFDTRCSQLADQVRFFDTMILRPFSVSGSESSYSPIWFLCDV